MMGLDLLARTWQLAPGTEFYEFGKSLEPRIVYRVGVYLVRGESLLFSLSYHHQINKM